jgi:hypothetical protein
MFNQKEFDEALDLFCEFGSKAFELVNLDFIHAKNYLEQTDISTIDKEVHSFKDSLENIKNGTYSVKRIIIYKRIRDLWTSKSNSNDKYIAQAARDLLEKGYSLIEVEGLKGSLSKKEIKIPLESKIRMFKQKIWRGDAFVNFLSNNSIFDEAITIANNIDTELYTGNKKRDLNKNIQVTWSAKDPSKSKMPELYENHFDLPYPNLKFFVPLHKMSEKNGVYSYTTCSNKLDSEKMAMCIAIALAAIDSQDKSGINCFSNHYSKSKVYQYINQEKIEKYISSFSVKYFFENAGTMIVTDNFGLHRKTLGISKYNYIRKYLHPLPYTRL